MKIGIADNTTLSPAQSSELGVSIQRYDVLWHGQEVFDGTLDFSPGVAPIVAVYGRAWDVPTTDEARSRYCGFVDSILTRYPNVAGVVVWNEPSAKVGQGLNWPAGLDYDYYGALLAACAPVIHSFGVKVIGPGMHPPRDADPLPLMKAVKRAGPHLLDAWDVHLYNGTSNVHDLIALVRKTLGWKIPVWVTEDGRESVPPPEFASLYTGTPWGSLWDEASEETQAYDVSHYMIDAYCAGASAWMNFKLEDERDLQRWQSGLERPDGSHKPSYRAFAVTAYAIERSERSDSVLTSSSAAETTTGPTVDCANPQPPPAIWTADQRLAQRLGEIGGWARDAYERAA